MIDKEDIKDALYCTVWAVVTILAAFALILAIIAIFKSTIWRIVVAIAVIVVVTFIYAYHQLKGRH